MALRAVTAQMMHAVHGGASVVQMPTTGLHDSAWSIPVVQLGAAALLAAVLAGCPDPAGIDDDWVAGVSSSLGRLPPAI